MALTLSKTGIATGNAVEASQVTQSIDALTGTAAYDITISGSLTLTGSLQSQGGITGSLVGTASVAISSSYALSASYAISSSRAVSSSYALSSSYAITSSYALTASSVPPTFPYTGSAKITGSLAVTGSIIASVSMSSENILTVGTLGVSNNYIEITTYNRITTQGSDFIPANIATPDSWLVINYTDNSGVTRGAYIPVYYTT